jgi:hypothetical protein
MNLSKFFIDRPIFAGVLSLLIFLGGLIAVRGLPISEYPEVVPPSIVVRANYPGANPKVIAETVATPLEEQINGVEGMLYMSSQATTDGLMTLTVTFKLGTDPDKAQQLVQNRVAQAEPRLPEEVRRLGITTVKSSPDLTMVVHLLSPNGRYDMTYLRNYAVLNVKDRLARIPAWATCSSSARATTPCASGWTRRRWPRAACRPATWWPPSASRTCRPPPASSAPRRACRASTCSCRSTPRAGCRPRRSSATSSCAPARRRGDPPARHRPHRAGRGRLRAALHAGQQGRRGRAHLPARAPTPSPSPTGCAPPWPTPEEHARRREVRDRLRPHAVRARLHRIGGAHPAGGHRPGGAGGHPVPADLARLHHPAAGRAGVGGGHLRRDALFGFSINALSLFGLVLAIGIVVDDAIVVVENVERNIEGGLTPRQATYRAMREVSGPIIAIALVLVAVFVPLAFITGLTGQFYRQFALTIAISTVISAINSLTLSPALAALLLKGHGEPQDWLTRGMDRVLGGFFRGFNRLFHRGAERYSGGVRGAISRKAVMLTIYAVLALLTVGLFQIVPGASCRRRTSST